MRELRRANSAVMIITHDLGVVSEMATRIAVMQSGRVVETSDDIESFFASPKHEYSRSLVTEARKMEL
jgi:ABC-type dipeptide/oligopeptide/nickel transport system ATPase component